MLEELLTGPREGRFLTITDRELILSVFKKHIVFLNMNKYGLANGEEEHYSHMGQVPPKEYVCFFPKNCLSIFRRFELM